MSTNGVEQVHTLEILKDEVIAAPIDIVFETILEQMGPYNEAPGTGVMPMTLEAWPGGRWFRDFGDNAGHLWGHVKAIKPPTLLEICGPLFMSTPAISNVQYRLTEEGAMTRVKFVHRAMGSMAHDGRVEQGWSHLLGRIQAAAKQRSGR